MCPCIPEICAYCLHLDIYFLHKFYHFLSAVLGGTCSSTTTCSTAFSFCDTSQSPRVCRCTSNYYDDNGENVPDGSCDQSKYIFTLFKLCKNFSLTCLTFGVQDCLLTVPEC